MAIGYSESHKARQATSSYPNSCPIPCWIVAAEHAQHFPATNSHLLDKWHQVVRNSLGIFPDLAGRMSSHRVKVSEQYDVPFLVGDVHIPKYVLDEQLGTSWGQ